MSLTKKLSPLFDAKTRSRGQDYFRDGSIASVSHDRDGAYAWVLGSGPQPYQVHIAKDDPYLDMADCSCPRFASGFLCKHIWAMLLFLDHRTDAGVAQDKGTRRNALPKNQPAWQAPFARLALLAEQMPGVPGKLMDRASGKKNEVWYALNVGATTAARDLTFDILLRKTKKNGEFGKAKAHRIDHQNLDTLTNVEDREALGLLLGSIAAESDSSYGGSWYDSGGSRFYLPRELYDVVLPKLAATGRLVRVLEKGEDVEQSPHIAWDDGPPWRCCVVIEDDADAQRWRINGQLSRDEQTRSIDEPVIALSSGLVLWEDRLARIDCDSSFAWLVELRTNGPIEVPKTRRRELLEQLWTQAIVPADQLPPELQLEVLSNSLRGKLQVQKEPASYGYRGGDLYAKVFFIYGDHMEISASDRRTGIVNEQANTVSMRDEDAEQALLAQLSALKIRPASSYEAGDGDVKFAKSRLGEIVQHLVHAGWMVEADGKLMRSATSMSVSVTSGVDWFDLEGEFDFDGVSAKLPELLSAVKKGEKFVTLDDGSQGMLPEAWLQKHGGLIEMAQADGDSLRFRPAQAMLLDALLAAQDNVTVDRGFCNFRKRLEKIDGVKPRTAPRGFGGELRDYQKQGLGWLHFLREFNFGGCLADDMGLGKTVQVLALLESRRTRRVGKDGVRNPSLVVVPKSLVFNWIEEAARFTPKLRMLDYTGLGRKELRKQFDEHDVIVTTYGTLRRDIAEIKETRFDYAILDESQAIKNHNAQSSKACRLLQADHRLAMTGTPVENHLGELWSLFEFLNPGMLGSSSTASSLMKTAGKGEAASLEVLRRGLAPYMLRRTKEQVLTELPNKNEQTLHCDMEPKQRKAYNELRDYYRALLENRIEEVGIQKSKIHVLEALLRLRQAACHPGLLDPKKTNHAGAKIDTLLTQLDEIVDEGHKVLVFSQFTSLLKIVRGQLDKRKITYEYLDGRTRKRQEKVERFQNDPACPLFLISMKAGGHGLNLTAADYVYILDPWWNPAVEAQAVDRAHRIGQTRPVFAYRLICRDTVEEKIIELQQRKRDLADAIVSEDASIMRSLTADDLQMLLS